MLRRKETRHFHAGKQWKIVDGEEFVEVAESKGRLFVSRGGLFLRPQSTGSTIVKGALERDGYRRISVGGVPHCITARVVWEVFYGEIPDGLEIDHVNTVRDDNRVENLRLVTHRENLLNPITRPRRRMACAANGAKGAAAQPREQILRNLALGMAAHVRPIECLAKDGCLVIAVYDSVKEAEKATGAASSAIIAVAKNRAHTAGGFKWRYAKKGDR